MIFRRSKKHVKQSMTTMDKVVTWVIIGGAAASIFWLSRTEKWKSFLWKMKDSWTRFGKKWLRIFWKTTVKILDFFNKK